jgi:hypothetical protein
MQNVNFDRWHLLNELVLPKLEILQLSCDEDLCVDFADLFTPGTIDCLKIDKSWKYLKRFVLRQSKIKHLLIHCGIPDLKVFDNLQLEFLQYQHRPEDRLERNLQLLMKQHPELEKVELESPELTPSILISAYCELTQLKYLKIVVDEENVNQIHRISQLPNLKEVCFDVCFDESIDFIQVVTIKLDNVEKVMIQNGFDHIRSVLYLETAGVNWPKLKELEMDVPTKFENGVDLLNEYFDNFKNLESLKLVSDPDYETVWENAEIDQSPQSNFNILSYAQQYPKMKSLIIENANVNHFEDLVSALPNLEYLDIDYKYGIDYTPRCLRKLLQLKKLTEVYLKFSTKSSMTRFNNQDVAMLKKLCKHLIAFKIKFEGRAAFYSTLRNLIGNCEFIQIESDEGCLKLADVEY